jgi:hypothetical protein
LPSVNITDSSSIQQTQGINHAANYCLQNVPTVEEDDDANARKFKLQRMAPPRYSIANNLNYRRRSTVVCTLGAAQLSIQTAVVNCAMAGINREFTEADAES